MTGRCRCGSSDLVPLPPETDPQNLISLATGDAGGDGRLRFTHQCRKCGCLLRVSDPHSEANKEGSCAT